jgi:serralysin
MAVRFSSETVRYVENRADGGYSWNVAYQLQASGSTVAVGLNIDLTGADPGSLASAWLNGIRTIWNNRAFFSDGQRLYEVKLNVAFVDSGAHQTVEVRDEPGRDDMSTWYLQQSDWGPGKQDELAAHEVGHMLGNFDEYAGGATYKGYTTTGTLMSDLTVSNIPAYFRGVELRAELYSGASLSTVAAIRGTGASDWLDGTAAMNGLYGFGGEDTLMGHAGNDFLNGGGGRDGLSGGDGRDILKGQAGNDMLKGGLGSDILMGGSGGDSFVFDTDPHLDNLDRIADFGRGADDIWLDHGIFAALNAGDTLNAGALVIGTAALDANDRILFNTENGRLSYDPDGTGAAAARAIAVLANFNGTIDAGDFLLFTV